MDNLLSLDFICVAPPCTADSSPPADGCPLPSRLVRTNARRTVTAVAAAMTALCAGPLLHPGEAAPKRPVARRSVAKRAARAHHSKKIRKYRRRKRVSLRPRGRILMPPQPLMGAPAPLPIDAIPRRPIVIMHPDRAPGAVKPPADDEGRTKVIHVPATGVTAATRGEPMAPVPAAPAVPPSL